MFSSAVRANSAPLMASGVVKTIASSVVEIQIATPSKYKNQTIRVRIAAHESAPAWAKPGTAITFEIPSEIADDKLAPSELPIDAIEGVTAGP